MFTSKDFNPLNLQREKTLTIEELAKHNQESDCLVVVEGKVHNMTLFIEKHPGGAQVIKDHCGKDATQVFNDQKEAHDEYARNILKSMETGKTLQQS